jgi:hypothetical protein
MNTVSHIRPAAKVRQHPCLQAVTRIRILLLLVPAIALLLAPVHLVAQADVFAGPWDYDSKIQYIITVAGSQLISDLMLSGARHVIKAQVTGPRTARGTWVSTSGDSITSDYNIEMTVSPDGREMFIKATRIQYGLREFQARFTRPGDWKAEARTATGPILAYTYQLGHELPLLTTESRPVALRINISLNDAYKRTFSIASVLLGGRNPLPGRYAADFDSGDNFYIYSNENALILNPELHAKEATFELPFVDFGVKPYLTMPKYFTTNLHVKLKSEIGEGDQTHKLEIPIHINSLFTVETIRCRRDAMPIFKGAKLPKDQPMKGSSFDELVIPPDAGVRVQFLDGTAVVYFNRDDVKWTLTMGAGKFSSTDSSRFVTNAYEINALIDEGLVKGAESATDRATEKGLEVLLRAVAGRSTTGLVMQISMFLGASRLGGEKVAIRLRSRVGVSLYKGGRIVVRNFAGAPEILSPGKPPLKIPVGFQAVVARGGVVRPPEPYPAGHPSVLVWSGDAISGQPDVAADNMRGSTSRFGEVLGKTITVREVAGANVYNGTWTRRDGTDIFDAVWNGSLRDVIRIEAVNGNRIVFYRQGNQGRYYGTLSADGNRVSAGTTSWYAVGWSWSGKVSGQPGEKHSPAAGEMFAGTWQGTWSNDLGEKGEDSLVLTEGPGGNLAGTWSGTIRVSGRRSGPEAMTLQGRTSTRSYQITGRVRGNILSMSYTVTRLDKGGTYEGRSTLTPSR